MTEQDNNEAVQESAPTSGKAVGKRTESELAKKPLPWYVEIPVVVILTMLFMVLLQTFVGRIYMIPSQSMEPTLHGCAGCVGDRIFVQKITYNFSDPKPGDVVVFEGTESWNAGFVTQRSSNPVIRGLQNVGSIVGIVPPDENNLVKRVIATGGQTVQCHKDDPGIMVDGQKIDDSFTLQPTQYPINPETGSEACGGEFFGPVTVPENHLFMMGDNRTNSADSRYHIGDESQGTIPIENVKGKVEAIIFPFSRIGTIDDPEL